MTMRGDEGMGHEAPAKDRTLAVFGVAAAVAFALIAARAELRFMPLDPNIDDYHYARMAAGYPDEYVWAPFRNRPLVPLLVRMLPLPVTWGFATVTAALLGAAAAGMHRFLRQLFTARIAWIGLALFAVTGWVTHLIGSPFYVDAAVLAAAAWTMVWLVEDRWFPILLALPVAVAAHDLTLLLLIPVAVTAWRARKMPDAAVTGVLALGVWWFLHRSGIAISPNGRSNLLNAAHREEMVRWNAAKYGTVAGAVWAHFTATFGAAGFLAPFGWTRAPRVVRDAAWMLPACVLLCFNAGDWGRMFAVAAPVIIALACHAIGQSRDSTENSETTIAGGDTPGVIAPIATRPDA